jgi:hypothetical protein
MFHHDRKKVEEHTKHNEREILASETCGCISCSAMFKPEEVTAWQDAVEDAEHPERHVDRTAMCPHCGDAFVLGDNSGYKITPAYLDAMRMR